jgi:hypothetical protein
MQIGMRSPCRSPNSLPILTVDPRNHSTPPEQRGQLSDRLEALEGLGLNTFCAICVMSLPMFHLAYAQMKCQIRHVWSQFGQTRFPAAENCKTFIYSRGSWEMDLLYKSITTTKM